jgi:hypothetical protein
MWNRAGSASFQIRTNDPMAYKIMDNVDLNDIRGTVRKCVGIRRNDVDLWSGPIWGIQGALDAGQMTISCVGWIEKWQYEMLTQVADYSNGGYGLPTDQIVFGLMELINGQDPAHPLLIQPGTVTGTMPIRNRYYPRFTMLGPSIQELSDIESGPDINVDPVTRQLNLVAWDEYTVRDDIVLGYNWGANNLKDMQWQDEYGNFSQYVTLTGANQTILEPYAVEQLVILSRPLLTYTIIPHPRMNNLGPTLFDDFQIGDGIFFSAIKDCVQINRQQVRVFGASISLDDNDNEIVSSLQITPPSPGQAYTPPS